MEIRYLKYQEIDHQKWDRCITLAFNGNVYALSWYLDIVCYGWEALVEGDYERVMPLTPGRKAGISYLYQPFFTQQLGIYSISELNAGIVSRFISAIPKVYRFIEINLNAHNKLTSGTGGIKFLTNIELELIQPYDKLFRAYSENARRNIRKAVNHQLAISEVCAPEQIVNLFRQNKGREIEQFADRQYNMLTHLMHTCIYRGTGRIVAAYSAENELCGAAFITTFKNRTVFLFSANNPFGKNAGAMFLIINSIVKEKAGSNHIFDFEGSNNEALARFYLSFGSSVIQYPQLVVDRLPSLITFAVRQIKKIRSRYFLSL